MSVAESRHPSLSAFDYPTVDRLCHAVDSLRGNAPHNYPD
jgi:hypothetical protein